MSETNIFISQEFGNLSVAYTGKQQCPPNHSWSYTLSGEYLIHYIFNGKGTFICGGKEYHLKKGDAFLISDEKGYYCADADEPWEYAWIRFSGEIAKRFIKTVGLSVENPIYQTANPDRISQKFNEILSIENKNNEFMIYGKLLTLFGEMVEYSANEVFFKKRTPGQYMSLCRDYVAMNYHMKITAADLAKVAGLEYSYLFRLFKQSFGISPGEYIISFKLSKAAGLLKDTDIPVSEIASSVGYDDRIAFSKLFKKKHGVSPQCYRQNN